ncbi:MAG: hypothetical protein Greene041679_198, partial [Parcubacteria group bacterium Greene0416_79]
PRLADSAGPSPRFPFPFFLKNARVFFKSVMEKRGEGRAAVFTQKNARMWVI